MMDSTSLTNLWWKKDKNGIEFLTGNVDNFRYLNGVLAYWKIFLATNRHLSYTSQELSFPCLPSDWLQKLTMSDNRLSVNFFKFPGYGLSQAVKRECAGRKRSCFGEKSAQNVRKGRSAVSGSFLKNSPLL